MQDETIIQLTVIVIVGAVAILLAVQNNTSYLPIITAIIGLITPSPVAKLLGFVRK